jgi:hypothetical protein
MQWYTVAGTSKKTGTSYKVVEMADKMKDFSNCCSFLDNCDNIKLKDVKSMKLTKDDLTSVYIKYSHKDLDFVKVELRLPTIPTPEIRPLPTESMVSRAKKNDLLWMCKELIIPQSHHSFYESLNIISTAEVQTVISSESSESSPDVAAPSESRVFVSYAIIL